MVFITIMTRGAARFFRFFLKNPSGIPVVKDPLTTPDRKKPHAAILARPRGAAGFFRFFRKNPKTQLLQ